jgi:predicted transcriptional regulator
MANLPTPTDRELEILQILWDRGEATVRQVYEQMSQSLPIVQNTVQAFLRTMEQKGLVEHRTEGRTFIYRPTVRKEPTNRRLATRLLKTVFDGAVDQLVETLFSANKPSAEELDRLEALIKQHKHDRGASDRKSGKKG